MSDVVIKVDNLIEPAGFAALTATAKAASAEPPSAKPSPTPPGPRSTVHGSRPKSAISGPLPHHRPFVFIRVHSWVQVVRLWSAVLAKR